LEVGNGVKAAGESERPSVAELAESREPATRMRGEAAVSKQSLLKPADSSQRALQLPEAPPTTKAKAKLGHVPGRAVTQLESRKRGLASVTKAGQTKRCPEPLCDPWKVSRIEQRTSRGRDPLEASSSETTERASSESAASPAGSGLSSNAAGNARYAAAGEEPAGDGLSQAHAATDDGHKLTTSKGQPQHKYVRGLMAHDSCADEAAADRAAVAAMVPLLDDAPWEEYVEFLESNVLCGQDTEMPAGEGGAAVGAAKEQVRGSTVVGAEGSGRTMAKQIAGGLRARKQAVEVQLARLQHAAGLL
jgi:hypothetical protein